MAAALFAVAALLVLGTVALVLAGRARGGAGPWQRRRPA